MTPLLPYGRAWAAWGNARSRCSGMLLSKMLGPNVFVRARDTRLLLNGKRPCWLCGALLARSVSGPGVITSSSNTCSVCGAHSSRKAGSSVFFRLCRWLPACLIKNLVDSVRRILVDFILCIPCSVAN
jgi:hypothetical protein